MRIGGDQVGCGGAGGYPGRCGSGCHGLGTNKLAAGGAHTVSPRPSIGIYLVVDKRGTDDARQVFDAADAFHNHALIGGLQQDNQFALDAVLGHIGLRKVGDGRNDRVYCVGSAMHHQA